MQAKNAASIIAVSVSAGLSAAASSSAPAGGNQADDLDGPLDFEDDVASLPGSDTDSTAGTDSTGISGGDTGSTAGSDSSSTAGSDSSSSAGGDTASIPGTETSSLPGSDSSSTAGGDSSSLPGSDPSSTAGSDIDSLNSLPGPDGDDGSLLDGGQDPQQAAKQKPQGFAGAFTLAVNIVAPEWSIFGLARGEDVSERGVSATVDRADVAAGEDVELVAEDNPSIAALAGALAIGLNARAFGAALGWNQVNGSARAAVTDSTIASGGAVSLRAEKGATTRSGQATIVALAIGGAAAKTGGAVGISAAVNGVIARVDAEVDGSAIRAGQGLSIEARDTSSINALTGAVGVSLKSYAGGVAASGNYIDSRVKAQVDDSSVVAEAGSVEIHAKQEANIRVATVGVAATAKGISLAGSIGLQVVLVETVASIEGDSQVTAADNVRVRAETDVTVGAGSGQISISGSGKFAGGAALNLTVISNRTDALIGAAARVATTSAAGRTFRDVTRKPVAGVSVEASSDIFVLGIAIGGSVGAGVSASASGTLNVIASVTRARSRPGAMRGTRASIPRATSTSSPRATSGFPEPPGRSAAARSGWGIGADIGVIAHRTEAYIDDDVTVEADGSVFVQALATESVVSVSAAVALAGKVAVGGTAGVGVLRSHTRASIGDRATVWALGNVLVAADSDTTSWIASASIAGSGTAAVGIGFQIGVLEKSTRAYIGDATVTALARDDAVETFSGGAREALGFSGAEVDAGRDRIAIANHDLNDGDRVVYEGSTALNGLRNGEIYYVIRVDADTIQLASTESNARNGVAVDIGTGNGSAGADHLLRRIVDGEGAHAHADFKTSAVDAASDTIAAEDHGFTDGQEVLYFTDARALGGMETEGRYWVIRVDDDRFKLAATREDALEGRAIDLDTAELSPDQAHHVKALADESLPELDNARVEPTVLAARSGREPETASRKGVIVVAREHQRPRRHRRRGRHRRERGGGADRFGHGALDRHQSPYRRGRPDQRRQPQPAHGRQRPGRARERRAVLPRGQFRADGRRGHQLLRRPRLRGPGDEGLDGRVHPGQDDGEAYDTGVAAQRDVTVTAQAESGNLRITGGAAVTLAGAALAGSVSVLVVNAETLASIDGRVRVTAGGNVLVSASDDTSAINFAGGIGLVGKGFAGAGAIPVTVITKRTTAEIGDHAIVDRRRKRGEFDRARRLARAGAGAARSGGAESGPRR